MSTNARLIAVIAVLVVIAAGVTYVRDRYFPSPWGPKVVESDIRSEPTDFSEIGTLRFDDTAGPGQFTPTFEYDDGRKPLVFDALSFCALGQGSVPCMAMSVTLDIPMKDKQALVEGNELSDGTILVRKLRIADEGAPLLAIDTGHRFISWQHAETLIRTCKVEMVMQTHALDIHLTLKNGERLRSVEPTIDEVFRVTQEASQSCGSIGVATE